MLTKPFPGSGGVQVERGEWSNNCMQKLLNRAGSGYWENIDISSDFSQGEPILQVFSGYKFAGKKAAAYQFVDAVGHHDPVRSMIQKGSGCDPTRTSPPH